MLQRQRPHLSPPASGLDGRLPGGPMSRRSLLAGSGALGVGAVLSACGGIVADDGGSRARQTGKPSPAVDRSAAEKVINWANWPGRLDYDRTVKEHLSLAEFDRQTGITTNYFDEIEDNAAYYATVQAQLHQGVDIQRDILVLTDWVTARMISDGLVQQLDPVRIPNARHLLARLRNVDFDTGRHYSLPWQGGFTGLAYNVRELRQLGVSPPTTVDDLWDPRLRNRVVVLSEMRDTIGMIMLGRGVDVAAFTAADFRAALTELDEQLNRGQIRQVADQSYLEALTSGDALAVIGWSGDIAQANADLRANDPTLTEDPFAFVKPSHGALSWTDNLVIPVGSPHKENAERLINYYYDPAVAARVAVSVHYVSPVQGARDELARLPDVDKALRDSPLIFPPAVYLADVHQFRPLTPTEEATFTLAFQKVLGL